MADTGHGGAVALATSGLSLDIISVSPPEESVEDVETSHLGLADGSHRTYMPGDLIEGGDLVVKVAVDPDYDAPLRVVENITLTWPLSSGKSTAANWAFSGYSKAYAPGELVTSERMEADLTIKVAGDITKTDAAV